MYTSVVLMKVRTCIGVHVVYVCMCVVCVRIHQYCAHDSIHMHKVRTSMIVCSCNLCVCVCVRVCVCVFVYVCAGVFMCIFECTNGVFMKIYGLQ